MANFSSLPAEIIDIILQCLIQQVYVSLIYDYDRSFFKVMKAIPGGERIGERLFYDTDTTLWPAEERWWRIQDLEDVQYDQEESIEYAKVRQHYYEQGMLSWQDGVPHAGIQIEVVVDNTSGQAVLRGIKERTPLERSVRARGVGSGRITKRL